MERCASASTQTDVDESILDYLTYTAIKALLADWGARREDGGSTQQTANSSLHLQTVESFLELFRSMHPGHRATTDIRFRLQLLRFTAMFTSRFDLFQVRPSSSCLQEIRRRYKNRANAFDQDLSSVKPVHHHNLNPMDSAQKTGQIARSLYPSSETLSLLDTLPSFMAISATKSVLQDMPITDIWMKLAAGFMAHAALEQSLVHGVPLLVAIREAFAWGLDPDNTAEEGSEDWQENAMFLGEDEEVAGWSEIKRRHMQLIIPPAGSLLAAHVEDLLEGDLPLDNFEENILSFIEGLLDAQSKPLYVQLEQRCLDGQSWIDTTGFRDRVQLGEDTGYTTSS